MKINYRNWNYNYKYFFKLINGIRSLGKTLEKKGTGDGFFSTSPRSVLTGHVVVSVQYIWALYLCKLYIFWDREREVSR